MKRFLSFLLIFVLLAGCFAGCGQEEPGETATLPPLEVDPRFESLAQEAVVKTALAFLDRGKYIQYDDTRFSQTASPVVYRWEVGMKSPEDYTRQFTGYTNCASFTYDVYLQALDYDIGAYTTANLTAKGTSQKKYTYIPTGNETDEEKAAVEADFRKNLQIGDIIVIRYNGDMDGNGHAMLYVGDQVLEDGKDIIHSTGRSYDYKSFSLGSESNGTVQTMSTDTLFSSNSRMHIFTKTKSLVLIRPLATFDREVPEKTQNRIRYMEGIVAEKLSSHPKGTTVNPGEEMTFTFSIRNKNDADVTLEVQDTVPSNCTYLSGAEKTEGDNLYWQVTVPAKKAVTVSYKVTVNSDAAYGQVVHSDAGTVGGVDVDCPRVFIQKTLTAQEQEKLLDALDEEQRLAVAGEIPAKTGMALADAVYQRAFGETTGLPTDFATLDSTYFSLYLGTHYRLKGEGGALDLIPEGMFGGRKFTHRSLATDYMRLEYVRTRLPMAENLIPGDIVMAVGGPNATDGSSEHLFLFTGEKLLNLNTGAALQAQYALSSLLGYERFVVIRPSIGM